MMTEYKADLHVHTLASPDGRSTQEELARAARDRGLCALAVTDHDLCTPIDERRQEELGVLLIPGVEISTSIGHITGLFLERPVDLEGLGKLPPPDKAVGAIHDAGGLAVLEKETSYTAKGMSQWAKRRRAGGPKNLAIGAAYIVRCLLKDMLRRS